jgi:hypothetical protein
MQQVKPWAGTNRLVMIPLAQRHDINKTGFGGSTNSGLAVQ